MSWFTDLFWPAGALSDLQRDVSAVRLNARHQNAKLDTIHKELIKMAGQTEAALAELSSSIDEVAGELEDIAAKLDEALANDDAIDAATAEAIRGHATRLRGLRPDPEPPVEPEPAPEG